MKQKPESSPSKRFFRIAVPKIIESYLELVNTVHTAMFVF